MTTEPFANRQNAACAAGRCDCYAPDAAETTQAGCEHASQPHGTVGGGCFGCLTCGAILCGDGCFAAATEASGMCKTHDAETNDGPFVCKATGCGYFDAEAVAFGAEPDYCPLHGGESTEPNHEPDDFDHNIDDAE